MTALVSIDLATGRFRRYTRFGRGEIKCTHDLTIEPEKWRQIQRGDASLDTGSLEHFRLAGIPDTEVA